MMAVIIAPGITVGMEPLNEHYPTPMLPLMDRPFVQHLVEYVVEQGILRLEFIFSHLPEKLEYFLGDGSRWGCSFGFHLARDPLHPYDMLKTIGYAEDEGAVLVGHADILPEMHIKETSPEKVPGKPVLLFVNRNVSSENGADPDWTGWGWISRDTLKQVPDNLDKRGFESHLRILAGDGSSPVEAEKLLNMQSYGQMLSSHKILLRKEFPGITLKGKEADEGIWLSRNVSLHPTAIIEAPVFIGENCRIGKGTHLGPDAVIGRDCILDSDCTVTGSIVFPGSYVGEGLELNEVIIDRSRLISIKSGAAVSIADNFILGGMTRTKIWQLFSRFLSRLAACALLILLFPILLFTILVLKLFRRGPVVFRKEVIHLPAAKGKTSWRSFHLLSLAPIEPPDGSDSTRTGRRGLNLFLEFLPAIINIIKGDLCFVGAPPRSEEEIEALSPDWQAIYLKTKPGIVTEAFVNYGSSPTEDELYTSEAFYSVTTGIGHDFKLFFGYFDRLIRGNERIGD